MSDNQIKIVGTILLPIILFVAKIVYDKFRKQNENTGSYNYSNNTSIFNNSGNIIDSYNSNLFNNGGIIAKNSSSINIDNSTNYYLKDDISNNNNKEIVFESIEKRLLYALERINLHRTDDEKVTYGKISVELKYQSLEDLNAVIKRGDIVFVNEVSNLLGVNRDWLRDGVKEAFFIENQQRIDNREFVWSDKYNFKEYDSVYKIIINKDCLIPPCNQYNAIIVQRRDEYKNLVLFDVTNSPFELLNPCPGDEYYSGCSSALRFYLLINMMKQKQWEAVSQYKTLWVKDSSYQDRTYFVNNNQFEMIVKEKDYIDNVLYDVKEKEHDLAYALFYRDSTFRINSKYDEWLSELKAMVMRMNPEIFV